MQKYVLANSLVFKIWRENIGVGNRGATYSSKSVAGELGRRTEAEEMYISLYYTPFFAHVSLKGFGLALRL
jgi:hypothetical protein